MSEREDMSTSSQRPPRFRALRGATTVERDSPADVIEGTTELLSEMLGRNGIRSEDIVSVLFTATPDLTSEFPAKAARGLGLSEVPVICAAEIPVAGAQPRCIRVLLHFYSGAPPGELQHVYLREARSLRMDLQ